jgi:hypothetical protein
MKKKRTKKNMITSKKKRGRRRRQWKTTALRFADQTVTETPVTEILSESHSIVAVHEWQFAFRKRIEKRFPKYRNENIFDRFITDCSFALFFGINSA